MPGPVRAAIPVTGLAEGHPATSALACMAAVRMRGPAPSAVRSVPSCRGSGQGQAPAAGAG